MKKILFSLMLLVITLTIGFTQSVGIGTTTPDASAVLELKAINKGFLPPRMTASQKSLIPSPKAGLLIYQTDGTAGLYVYNGTAWTAVAASATVLGGWSLTGNAGTNESTNFLGTTDAKPLMFKTNNAYSGQISNNGMVAFGTGAAALLSDASIVAIGKNALLNNGTGATGAQGLFNTAVGSQVLQSNTTGLNNTGLGYNSLISNTAGQGNTAAGAAALLSNSTGQDNTSIGNQSLFSNQTGINNTATGVKALYNNKATGNTANGVDALKSNTTGAYNTAVGINSLSNNLSGSFNTALGISSLTANTGGNYNLAIGYQANVLTNNLTRATAIGTEAKVGCSDCVVLGNENAKVGIGIDIPTAKLHVNPAGTGGIYIGGNETAGGFTGLALGVSNTSGGHGYIQATQAAGSLSGDLLLNPNGGQVGIGYTNQTSVQFPLDINQTGSMGIRLKAGVHNWAISNKQALSFEYNGSYKSHISVIDGAYFQMSDGRLKKDVVQIGSVLDKVMALKPKNYKYISNENSKDAYKISIGFIAQEVMPLFPNLVSDSKPVGKDSTNKTVYHGVNYAGFSVVAIKAIQEQQEEIETLKTTNTSLAIKLENVEAKLAKMQEVIEALQKK
jgi:hypothetical protein